MWVIHYWLRGIDGLRPKRSAFSDQSKLQMLAHQHRGKLFSREVAAALCDNCFDNATIESFFAP